MKYIQMFFRRITKDFQQKQLLPLKLLFFIHASTIFVLYPYLTIHMRELGINVEETAIMSAVTPAVAIVMPPLAGMIADKIGNFRVILAFFSAAGGGAALLLLLVPVGRITITYPDRVIFDVACNPGSSVSLALNQEHACQPLHPFSYRTHVQLETCGFVCQADANAFLNSNDSKALLTSTSFGVQLHKVDENLTRTFNYTLKNAGASATPAIELATRSNKIIKNNEFFDTSVRKLSKNSYYFPTAGLYNFSCELKDSLDGSPKPKFANDRQKFFCKFASKEAFDRMERAFKQDFIIGIIAASKTIKDIREGRQWYDVDYLDNKNGKQNGSQHDSLCLRGFSQNSEHVSINVALRKSDGSGDSTDDTVYREIELSSCAPRCLASAPRKEVCSNPTKLLELDMTVTFWSYLCIRVFVGMIGGTAFAMFEGAVIAILREHKADYGLQRIYASIGGMISSPLSGWMIDYASRGKGYTDFRPAFYLYASLKIASGLLMLSMNLEFKTPAKNVISDVITVLKKVELIALFISCFILGTAWGYIESFLFWLIQDLGGSKSLMGITITVGGIAGIPLLVMSGPIIKRIGHANVIFIGFIFYGIRLMGYSLIYNPWHCLIFEAMESITSSLAFTAAVTYAAKLSTTTTDTSIQGMLGGLYFGVGKGSGSLIGGYLMKAVGTRPTYQIFAAMTVVTGIVYFLFNYFWMRKYPSEGTDITKKDSITHKEVELPIGFVEIDLMDKKANMKTPAITVSPNDGGEEGQVEKPPAIENGGGAVTNMGYEDTETFAFDDSLHENEEKTSDRSPPETSQESSIKDQDKK